MRRHQANDQSFLVRSLDRPLKNAGVALLFLGLMGCCGSNGPKPDITIPSPKLYTDDQVLKTFAARRAALRELTSGISTETLQEVLRVKQQSQMTINVSAAPAGSTGTSGQQTAPAPSTLSDISPPANFGLPAEGTLRKRISLDQNITGYELLYLGDNELLGEDKQAVLVRLDLSVN